MDCDKAKVLCRIDVSPGVVDQETLRGRVSDFVQKQVEDSQIRFDQFNIPGQNDVIKQIKKGIFMSCTRKCFC